MYLEGPDRSAFASQHSTAIRTRTTTTTTTTTTITAATQPPHTLISCNLGTRRQNRRQHGDARPTTHSMCAQPVLH